MSEKKQDWQDDKESWNLEHEAKQAIKSNGTQREPCKKIKNIIRSKEWKAWAVAVKSKESW